MNISSFMRFTGICSMIGGVLFVSLAVFYNVPSIEHIGSYFNLIGMVLLLLALVGMYLRQAEAAGIFGFITFLLAFVGAALWGAMGFVWAFVLPFIEKVAPQVLESEPSAPFSTGMNIAMITFFGGIILFGLVTALKGVLPRGAGILFVLVPLMEFIPYADMAAQPVAGVAMVWFGYSLWKGKYEVGSTGNG